MLMELVDRIKQFRRQDFTVAPSFERVGKLFKQLPCLSLIYFARELAKRLPFELGEFRHRSVISAT